MSPLFFFRGLGDRRTPPTRTPHRKARRTGQRRSYRGEWLERRDMLSYVATFGGGILSIQNVGAGSDTAVLKADKLTGEIFLDGNNSGNFVDTGANLNSNSANAITGSIQISAGSASNSNFIIDNNAGAFFQPTAFSPTFTGTTILPTFTYNGGAGNSQRNNSLTVRGKAGIADTFV